MKGKSKKLFIAMLAAVLGAALFLAGCQSAAPTGIELDISEVATTLNAGEELDLSKLKITVTYSDKSTKVFKASDTIITVDSSALNNVLPGKYDVTISFLGFNKTIEVTVNELVETGFYVDRSGIPAQVDKGYELDTAKIKVYAMYQDTVYRTLIENGYNINNGDFDGNTSGMYTVTVTYKQYASQTFNVFVPEEELVATEGDTFVLYSHIPYTLAGGATNLLLTDSKGTEIELISDDTLPVLDSGDYTLQYKNASNEQRTKTLKVVDYLQVFAYGADYQIHQDTVSKIGTESNKYIRNTADKYLVGTANIFCFDIKLEGIKEDILADQRLLDYSFEIKSETDNTFTKAPDDLIEMSLGKYFRFSEIYDGREIRVTVDAKYNEFQSPLVFNFVLNDGYNVFSNSDLKEFFGDLDVHSINIHREIEALLDNNQINPDGTPKNYWDGITDKYLSFNNDGKLVNESGNVYVRYSTSVTNNLLTVNGNYYNINAKDVPLLKPHTEYADQPDKLNVTGTETEITNSQTAIFYVRLESTAMDVNVSDTLTTEQFNQQEGNKVTFNNLTILGNTVTPTGDPNSEENMKIVYENSGGFAGIRNRTDVEVNNTVIRFTCIGLFSVRPGTDTIVNDSLIEESWANNIYSWGGSLVSVTNSKLKNAGGSAIWFEDVYYQTGDIYDPHISMDNATVIENYVAGTEAWFVAQNMQLVAPELKMNLQGGINALSNGTKTILKNITRGGINYETFNFTIVTVDKYSITDENIPVGYEFKRQKYTVGNVTMQRLDSEVSSDSRLLTGGTLPTFIAPINQYSSKAAFETLIGQIMATGKDMQTAFYTAMYQCLNETGTKYVEVIIPNTNIPELRTMTFITEFYSTNT